MHRFAIIILALIMACSPTRRIMQDAVAYENSGMYDEAYQKYLEAYKDHLSTDAHIALKDLAQRMSNKKFSEAQMLAGMNKFESALNALDLAEDFFLENQWLGIQQHGNTDALRIECKNGLAAEYYALAHEAMQNEQYEDVQMYLSKVFRNNPKHQDARYLEKVLSFMPAYKKGLKAMELGLYREAFFFFDDVASKDADFGNVLSLRDECRNQMLFTLSYVVVHNNDAPSSMELAIATSAKQKILDLKNPFVKLVEREQIDVLLGQQQSLMLPIFDQNHIIDAGKLLGAEFLVVGEVIAYENSSPNLTTINRTGILGKTRLGKRVQYKEFMGEAEFTMIYRYHLVNAETGEILAAESIPFSLSQKVHYAVYPGDATQLYPAEPASTGAVFNDLFYPSEEGKAKLDQLLQAPQTVKPEAEILTECFNLISQKIATKVNEFALSR